MPGRQKPHKQHVHQKIEITGNRSAIAGQTTR
jgi:hypothetical protein